MPITLMLITSVIRCNSPKINKVATVPASAPMPMEITLIRLEINDRE